MMRKYTITRMPPSTIKDAPRFFAWVETFDLDVAIALVTKLVREDRRFVMTSEFVAWAKKHRRYINQYFRKGK